MNTNELKNREQRLRYAASKKGLRIQKETHEPITGYLISKENSTLVIAGYNNYHNLLSISQVPICV